MASLNQLVSEFAHAVGNPNSIPLRRNLRYAILHGRNELIRKSYENHKYVDKGIQQRIRVSIINIPDGDLYNSQTLGLPAIKRTKQEVPKPVRLINNLPFQSIRTTGHTGIEIPFAKKLVLSFIIILQVCVIFLFMIILMVIIYFFSNNKDWFQNIGSIIIESPFEIPYLIPTETVEKAKDVNYDPIDDEAKYDDDEFLIPEDMIGALKRDCI